jgi:NAD(P)-dependent dehydrogenase (short-subunit alcohol dehydrogenase family)
MEVQAFETCKLLDSNVQLLTGWAPDRLLTYSLTQSLTHLLTAGHFHAQDISVFESSMRLNYLGVVCSLKAVYGGMVARNSGHICLISSVMGTMGEWLGDVANQSEDEIHHRDCHATR